MAVGRSWGVPSLIGLIVALALMLGFHWIWFNTESTRRICVLPKKDVGFDTTFVKSDSMPVFALQHPTLAARLMTGSGTCVSF